VTRLARAAGIDEVLSSGYQPAGDGALDMAASEARLAAWCKSSANGDWALFSRRLARDGLELDTVRATFAESGSFSAEASPAWLRDCDWVRAALGRDPDRGLGPPLRRHPFDDLYLPLLEAAELRLCRTVGGALDRLSATARADLRDLLYQRLGRLLAPSLYDRFSAAGRQYSAFVVDMRSGGLGTLFAEKPVLLRLVADLTRQWLDTVAEFVVRLHDDAEQLRGLTEVEPATRVAHVEGGLSDPHDGGRTVLAVEFDDRRRVIYKPRDLRVDVAWAVLVERLNDEGPVRLRAPGAVARDGYGWTEFIEHTGCGDERGCATYFRRAGALLALLHCLAAGDFHHENVIAAGDQPVAIDLETLFQPLAFGHDGAPAAEAFDAATEVIANSVMAVGLLPGYGHAEGAEPVAVGGVAAYRPASKRVYWEHVNTDAMQPALVDEAEQPPTNLPHVSGQHAVLGDYLDEFCCGFRDYAAFLANRDTSELLADFAGLPVRTVLRPTQFYDTLLNRLQNDTTMSDGVVWSAQADFLARLANWESDDDPTWAAQRAERAALLQLNVPRFLTTTDGTAVSDGSGPRFESAAKPGLERASARSRRLDEDEIAWQESLIRQVSALSTVAAEDVVASVQPGVGTPTARRFTAEADAIADELAATAIRRRASAAWTGLRWFVDSDVAQLAVVGHDLYNGAAGIATFLAAHAKTTGSDASADLARASVAHLRSELTGGNAAHAIRLLGIGGATGLGSIVYAFALMADFLDDQALLADARHAALLIDDELIAADRRLDVIGGSAGAILGLLRLHRDDPCDDVLARAIRCGEHLLAQEVVRNPPGDQRMLNGMSHGAAGFAHALAALGAAAGRSEFTCVAGELIEAERTEFEMTRADWKDARTAEPHWRSQWCHGAVGIGLARLGMVRLGRVARGDVELDVRRALEGATRGWPGYVDTLCCGSLGNVELLRTAGATLSSAELTDLAAQRLASVLAASAATGTYRWNGGAQRFNPGLFRGLSGAGYTCLRALDDSLPNVLIWE
jgi:type 2 lantibiotic biosynthesis protein LanM